MNGIQYLIIYHFFYLQMCQQTTAINNIHNPIEFESTLTLPQISSVTLRLIDNWYQFILFNQTWMGKSQFNRRSSVYSSIVLHKTYIPEPHQSFSYNLGQVGIAFFSISHKKILTLKGHLAFHIWAITTDRSPPSIKCFYAELTVNFASRFLVTLKGVYLFCCNW